MDELLCSIRRWHFAATLFTLAILDIYPNSAILSVARSTRSRMSFSIDTNLLLYASDTSARDHAAARKFVEGRGGRPGSALPDLADADGVSADCNSSGDPSLIRSRRAKPGAMSRRCLVCHGQECSRKNPVLLSTMWKRLKISP
jgi:hypothetical protein